MTLEKPVLLTWERTSGCQNDKELREFANALARKRKRPALPNAFVELIRDFQEKCKKSYGKQNQLGRALEAIHEIRVQAYPQWSENIKTQVLFHFLIPEGMDQSLKQEIDEQIKYLMSLIKQSEVYEIDYQTVSYYDISAAVYISSDQLDLDYLSN